MMKTMGLIPDVLTSGEKFETRLGSQRIYRTLSPRLTAEVEKIAQISWVGKLPQGERQDCQRRCNNPQSAG
jgi:hypothetical protein